MRAMYFYEFCRKTEQKGRNQSSEFRKRELEVIQASEQHKEAIPGVKSRQQKKPRVLLRPKCLENSVGEAETKLVSITTTWLSIPLLQKR